MSREVFKPLGMDRTVLEGADEDSDDVTFYRGRRDPASVRRAGPAEGLLVFFRAQGRFSPRRRISCARVRRCLKPGLLKAETIRLFQTPLQLESVPRLDSRWGKRSRLFRLLVSRRGWCVIEPI